MSTDTVQAAFKKAYEEAVKNGNPRPIEAGLMAISPGAMKDRLTIYHAAAGWFEACGEDPSASRSRFHEFRAAIELEAPWVGALMAEYGR